LHPEGAMFYADYRFGTLNSEELGLIAFWLQNITNFWYQIWSIISSSWDMLPYFSTIQRDLHFSSSIPPVPVYAKLCGSLWR